MSVFRWTAGAALALALCASAAHARPFAIGDPIGGSHAGVRPAALAAGRAVVARIERPTCAFC